MEGAVGRWLQLTPVLHHCPGAETTARPKSMVVFQWKGSTRQLTQTFVIARNLEGNVLLVLKCREPGMLFHSLERAAWSLRPNCTQSERLGKEIVGSAAIRSVPWGGSASLLSCFQSFITEVSPLAAGDTKWPSVGHCVTILWKNRERRGRVPTLYILVLGT